MRNYLGRLGFDIYAHLRLPRDRAQALYGYDFTTIIGPLTTTCLIPHHYNAWIPILDWSSVLLFRWYNQIVLFANLRFCFHLSCVRRCAINEHRVCHLFAFDAGYDKQTSSLVYGCLASTSSGRLQPRIHMVNLAV
jgi:hypothetical protein